MYATRWVGKTHYWVGRLGTQPEEFLQIEIEELQETISHRLFPCEGMPSSIEEFIDRRETAAGSRQVLGAAFYRLRRITDVAAFLEAMRRQKPEPQPIHRFFSDWARSSANLACEFENHWVLSLREHLDRYHQTVKSATPVAAINGAKPSFAAPHVHGLPLAHAIARYDRQVGYPMAWFFHMLTIHTVPHTVAIAVIEDMDDGFGYLPDRDLEIVRDWLRRCYGF
ncbi:MAG: hypothetical protein N2441_01290 [Rhodocyclaceae bacterium]|nr:hypothetical protein [Rhodocyclaceae bacterium]